MFNLVRISYGEILSLSKQTLRINQKTRDGYKQIKALIFYIIMIKI